ncbi:hypothetical protein RHMOL_Rhmol13G0103300 [Rhododendron molle]|uniref:Uncharacterized protein n=1 Tax=Rhododendron molle TaxID=49168 RepID=A0ACC0L5L5_RHOML|nr:hypothetical protein RHMOL_Rhmol13G0103300 [Rhododendron molle]
MSPLSIDGQDVQFKIGGFRSSKVSAGPGDKPMIVVNNRGEEKQFAAEEDLNASGVQKLLLDGNEFRVQSHLKLGNCSSF